MISVVQTINVRAKVKYYMSNLRFKPAQVDADGTPVVWGLIISLHIKISEGKVKRSGKI